MSCLSALFPPGLSYGTTENQLTYIALELVDEDDDDDDQRLTGRAVRVWYRYWI